MVPRNIPAKSETSDADIDDWPTVEKPSAILAKGGAKKARKSALASPPTAELMMASQRVTGLALPGHLVALPGRGHVHRIARDIE